MAMRDMNDDATDASSRRASARAATRGSARGTATRRRSRARRPRVPDALLPELEPLITTSTRWDGTC